MSDATAISLLIGTFFLSFFASYYSSRMANDRMDEIILGVVKGVAVSRKHRTIMLYNQWFPMMSYPMGGSALVALANIQIGNSANTEGVRYLAYVFAGLAGWGALVFVFLGGSTLLNCLSALRQAEAD